MTKATEPQAAAPASAPAGEPASLGEQTLAGVRSMSIARIVSEAGLFASSIVLARLIAPAEFGRTAVAMFIGLLAIAVSQQGVGSFLVATKEPRASHFHAASLVAPLAGLAGAALTLLFAVTLAPVIFGSRAAYYVALASPNWLFAGIAAVPIALLQRELRFGPLGVVEASASVVGPGLAIALAVYGLEGDAIVIGWVAAAAVTAGLACWFARPPRPGWHRVETAELVRFAAPSTGSSVLYAGVRNIDYVLLAAFVPAFQVGLYMRAFALGTDYQSKISQILLNVSFPVLSRAKDLEEVRRVRARMIRVHATVLFPLLFGLIAVAPQFVPWLYGDRWAGAASLTQILALGGLISAVGTGTGPLLMATGHPRALFDYNLVTFFAYTAGILAAIPLGVTAVCVAVVLVRLITFVALQYFVVERRVGIRVLETVRDDVIPAMTAGLPLLAITSGGMRVALDAGSPVVVAMLLPGVIGIGVYAAILRAFFPATWSDVRRLMGRLPLPRAGAAPTS